MAPCSPITMAGTVRNDASSQAKPTALRPLTAPTMGAGAAPAMAAAAGSGSTDTALRRRYGAYVSMRFSEA